MFHELKDVNKTGDRPRRWFQDDYFDLIVWYDAANAIHGFQLCYDKKGDEHAFTWEKDNGFSHNRIDSGESNTGGGPKRTPILVSDGVFPFQKLVETIKARSEGLDSGLIELVLTKISEFAGTPGTMKGG